MAALREDFLPEVPLVTRSLEPSVSGFLEQEKPARLQSMSDLHQLVSNFSLEPPLGDKV